MVMQKKMMSRSKFAMLSLCILLANGSNLYADGFYTIIGPDGRPMIVPKKIPKDSSELIHNRNVADKSKQSNNVVEAKRESFEKQAVVTKTPVNPRSELTVPLTKDVNLNTVSTMNQTKENSLVEHSETNQLKQFGKSQINAQEDAKVTISEKKDPSKSLNKETSDINSNSDTELNSAAFSSVDGIEYVNNEYLENQEFNLEGKKRFYMMPDGTGRLETIERKKGISRSVLDKFMNKAQQSNAPISLSKNYIRLSPQELALAFENDRCFIKDYSKSIKTLTPQKEIGLWPTKPLKEKFEYELVKLDSSIQFMQIDSYASSNEKPHYYWPLVVFLDENGCIQEGVSGFKNGSTTATLFQHAAIQGIIKVPANAYYMMITPLASAVDVSEKELSNQGQVRISVLQ